MSLAKIAICFFLSLPFTSSAQKFKIELTQSQIIIKDITSLGGIYDALDWKDTKAVATYDVEGKSIQIDYADGTGIRYFIVSEAGKVLNESHNVFQFNVLQTLSNDGYKSSSKGVLKLTLFTKEQEKRSVIVVETDIMYQLMRGKNAIVSY